MRCENTDSTPYNGEVHDLEEMLERLRCHSGDTERISVGNMLDSVGRRSFGTVLLLAGLIPASPLSAVPGLPTVAAVLAFIVIIQILTGHRHFWLPDWLLRRGIPRDKFNKAVDLMQKPASWIDKLIKPRLKVLTTGAAVYVIALLALVITVAMPVLELVPTANTMTGIGLCIFGLALISHDGILVIMGLVVMAGIAFVGFSALSGG